MIRTVLLLLAATLLAAQTSPSPAKAALAKRLVKAMDMENTMKASMNAMMLSQRQAMSSLARSSLGGSGFSGPGAAKAMDLMMNRMHEAMVPEMEKVLDAPAIIDEIVVPIYDRTFAADELRVIVEFYESPAGQKMVRNQPQMMQEIVVAMGPRQNQLTEKLLTLLNEKMPSILEEVRTAYPNAFSPAPAAKPKSPAKQAKP